MMRKALEEVIPTDKIAAIEARLTTQGEQLAKIAKTSAGGGPAASYAPIMRGGEPTDKGSLLAKAAEVIDEPRLKTDVSNTASLELIRQQRAASA
jgi:hypothetical protein